jgi:hypothetical protein
MRLASRLASQLIAAASATDTAGLDWPEVASGLQSAPRGLTDRERCDVLLSAANGEPIPLDLLNRLVGRPFITGKLDGPGEAVTRELSNWSARNLSAFFDLDDPGRIQFSKACHRDLRGKVLVAPGYDNNGRRDQVLATGINAAMHYALSILTDGKREFASLLCRCEYTKCGIFFFEKAPDGGGRGARIRKFCSQEHAKEGDREKARGRSRKRRDDAK